MTDDLVPLAKMPFRTMRLIHQSLRLATLSVVNVTDNAPVVLKAEIFAAADMSRKLKNPSRNILLGYICGWYDLLKQLRGFIQSEELAKQIDGLLNELTWVARLIEKHTQEKAQSVD